MSSSEKLAVYVASRASIPARSAMWREYRDRWGANIISSWIDEAGEGETGDFADLWTRIHGEILRCERFVLYAEQGDFPLKGALVEAGIALAARKPIWVMGNLTLEGRTDRPLGSWIRHPLVERINTDARLKDMAPAVGL